MFSKPENAINYDKEAKFNKTKIKLENGSVGFIHEGREMRYLWNVFQWQYIENYYLAKCTVELVGVILVCERK